MQTKSLAWCHFAAHLRYDCTEMLHSKMFVSISTFLSLCILLQVCPTSCSTKYYVAKNSELKKRFDDQKKMVSKDPIQTSNSNAYYIEDGYNSQELGGGGGYDHYGYSDGHHYVAIEKKHSKFFGDELSFVIIVVTLTVFFGILSSLLIPLTLMLINGGGLGLGGFGLGGLGGLGGGLGGLNNGILPVFPGGIGGGLVGRRRRSVTAPTNERTDELQQLFHTALGKFEMKSN